MEKVLTVHGMTCDHCKASVKSALGRLPGVRAVQVNLATGKVTIASDQELDEALLRRVIEEIGYDLD
jgi:copper chaperone CopZ